MKEIRISPAEDGIRLDRLLHKYMSLATTGFIYKMLRKKNITLNGKKAKGDERLATGDVVTLYLSDDTISGFQDRSEVKKDIDKDFPDLEIDILYEDDNIIIANKPAGILSQKSKVSDVSMNEYLKNYCLRHCQGDGLFTPSICNRLDRNTSGIITFGKTLAGSRGLSKLFKDRTIDKYYIALVSGETDEEKRISDYLIKDEKENRVKITDRPEEGALPIETEYRPLVWGGGYTLMEIKLITGKSHQIRAHLAAKGYPVIGDRKYGVSRFSAKHQMLHAARIVFPEDMTGVFSGLSGREICAKLPEDFEKIVNKLYPEFIL
ncbi:MAG: RluA family pseudouridine synthase [Lachnospiraceae bacterium]|nr:RluA family pseudouridine synthase [Lachnospiraceae bacterium]